MRAGTIGEAWVAVRPDVSKFGTESEKGVRSSLMGVAKVAGAVFAASKAKDFVADIIGGASDLQEAASKVGVVFGPQSLGAFQAWAAGADKAIGQSKQQALGAVGTFGNLLTAMGVTTDQAGMMSLGMTSLASDLASFNNTSVDDALLALRSGLTGETEPLKRFGVNLNEATLKAKAMELGLSDGKGVLDANAKAQAAYALIMEQTSKAQGDFARTSDGLANKQRIMSAQWENAKTSLGQAFLPVATAVVGFLSDKMIPGLLAVKDAVAEAWEFFAGGWSGEFTGEGEGVLRFLNELGLRLRAVVDWVVANWPKVQAVIVAGFEAVRDATVNYVIPAVEQVIQWLQTAVAWVQENWPKVQEVIVTTWMWVRDNVLPIVQEVVTFIVEKATEIWTWMQTIWPEIYATIAVVIDRIKLQIMVVVGAIVVIWRLFGDEILAYARIAWDYIKAVIEGAILIIQGIIKTVMALIRGDWSAAWDGIKQIISGVWTLIKGIIQAGVDGARLILSQAWSMIKTAASAAWDAIVGVVSGAIDKVVGFVSGLPGRLLGFVGAVKDAAMAIGKAIISGIADALGAAWDVAANIVGDIASGIKGAVNTILAQVERFINAGLNAADAAAGPFINFGSISLPRLHSGGAIPPSVNETLAVLRGGEVVFTPEQMEALGRAGFGGGPAIAVENLHVHDPLTVEAFVATAAGALAHEGIAA